MIKQIKSWLWWKRFNSRTRSYFIGRFMRVLYITCPYYEEEGKIYYISENDIYREAFRELSFLGLARARNYWQSSENRTEQDFNSWELLFDKLKEL